MSFELPEADERIFRNALKNAPESHHEWLTSAAEAWAKKPDEDRWLYEAFFGMVAGDGVYETFYKCMRAVLTREGEEDKALIEIAAIVLRNHAPLPEMIGDIILGAYPQEWREFAIAELLPHFCERHDNFIPTLEQALDCDNERVAQYAALGLVPYTRRYSLHLMNILLSALFTKIELKYKNKAFDEFFYHIDDLEYDLKLPE